LTIKSGSKSLVPEYVGEDGIGCFITEKYATGQTCGGMIGYVFDGKVDETIELIDKRVQDQSTQIALLPPGLSNSGLACATPSLRETRHKTKSGEITIYHLFVSTV
jgi:hypothetical protein